MDVVMIMNEDKNSISGPTKHTPYTTLTSHNNKNRKILNKKYPVTSYTFQNTSTQIFNTNYTTKIDSDESHH